MGSIEGEPLLGTIVEGTLVGDSVGFRLRTDGTSEGITDGFVLGT